MKIYKKKLKQITNLQNSNIFNKHQTKAGKILLIIMIIFTLLIKNVKLEMSLVMLNL